MIFTCMQGGGYAHHNCFILCTDVTTLHVNDNAMSVDALHILYYLLQLYNI